MKGEKKYNNYRIHIQIRHFKKTLIFYKDSK